MEDRLSTPRKLTLVGIIINILLLIVGIIVVYWLMTWLPLLLPPIPGWPGFFDWLIIIMIISFGVDIILGIILPAFGYAKLNPESWKTAAVILIISGILTIGGIGGILLIIAGAMAFTSGPAKSEVFEKPLYSEKPRPANVCAHCGAVLGGDDRYCAGCGAPVKK